MEWVETTIMRPSKMQYSMDEFRSLFDISEEVVEQLVRDNVIPPPARFNNRTLFFTWKHAALLQLRMEMGLQLGPSPRSLKEAKEK